MALTVPILGMHRSGTSLVAQMLSDCGLYLGKRLMDGNPSNLGGHFETWDAVEINDQLLAQAGGDWAHPPRELGSGAEQRPRMQAFLDTLSAFPVAGWKDPRTVLTFGLWKELLGPHRIVACLRHPYHVAQSLAVRDSRPLEEGLALWQQYNERLLEIVADDPTVVWFDFDQPAAWIRNWLPLACAELGLTFAPQALAEFNEIERHHHQLPPIEPGPLRGLYRELWYQAHSAQVRRSTSPAGVSHGSSPAGVVAAKPGEATGGAPTAGPAEPAATLALESLIERTRQLVDVVQKQNAVLQQDRLGHHHTRMHVDQALALRIQPLEDAVRDGRLAGESESVASLDQLRETLAGLLDERAERLNQAIVNQIAEHQADHRRALQECQAHLESADVELAARVARLADALETHRTESQLDRSENLIGRAELATEITAARMAAEMLLARLKTWEHPLQRCTQFLDQMRHPLWRRWRDWLFGSPAAQPSSGFEDRPPRARRGLETPSADPRRNAA